MGADQESDFYSSVSVEADAVLENAPEKSSNPSGCELALHQFPWWSKWITAFVCYTSGVFAAYAFKWQNKTSVQQCDDLENEDCRPIPFIGAFLQVLFMFIGEAFCFLIWNVDNLINRSRNRPPWTDFTLSNRSFVKPHGRWWHWAPLASLDVSASIMNNIAYTITYASTIQMLHNSLVIICAFEQLAIIRRALRIHEWIGVITVTIAMILTVLPAILNPETSTTNDGSSAWLGILLAILTTCLSGTQIILEEWLFIKSGYGPFKAVGIQGLTGIVLVIVAMPIAHFTALENVMLSFYQFFHSRRLMVITVFYLVASIGFTGGGAATIKLGGGLLRSMLSAVRGPSAWILDLITKWIEFEYYNLVAVFIFLAGFAIHVRCYPPNRFPRMHRFLSKPWHWCCTRPELDEDYVDEALVKKIGSIEGRAV
eukprot:Gregarina_sp_Poly_1__9874@NODE_640_length_7000_cov_184_134574_g489_i0_p4_GENE_NODE_640_length_7000_cov_184_134574_g489_i0NODE_640_length_7000_cov_184_134574_g489_i0_p4_ORF_typecomplete_len427_score29_30SLC35F/PF06027_12/1_6e02SLC35F/PF06027_12/1_4e23Nuc_sug_transp/PF04142_15/1_1e20CRTlike/PF08627_10/1_9e18CRTlike/PF08627_10/5_5e02UAA/PF08449_11/3e02UAA/PF08449_11/1_2e12TPT/PF03151_16/1_4e09PUNUT/PF16913_5/2_2e08Mg_trans_NIPA/PF05653_14/1_7e02Mg_trans_NIPA/PF05653_14/1_7Ferric_reduct/PF01794_19/8